MRPFIDPENLIRRFNEDEAVWRNYERLRALRRLLRPDSPLPADTLDYLDWLEAFAATKSIRSDG